VQRKMHSDEDVIVLWRWNCIALEHDTWGCVLKLIGYEWISEIVMRLSYEYDPLCSCSYC